MKRESRATVIRILAVCLSWIVAFLVSTADLLAILVKNPESIIGIGLIALYSPLFPIGLVGMIWQSVTNEEGKAVGYLFWLCLLATWVLYIAVSLGVVISRRRIVSLALYTVLCVLLVFNGLGCREMWRENTVDPIAPSATELTQGVYRAILVP